MPKSSRRSAGSNGAGSSDNRMSLRPRRALGDISNRSDAQGAADCKPRAAKLARTQGPVVEAARNARSRPARRTSAASKSSKQTTASARRRAKVVVEESCDSEVTADDGDNTDASSDSSDNDSAAEQDVQPVGRAKKLNRHPLKPMVPSEYEQDETEDILTCAEYVDDMYKRFKEQEVRWYRYLFIACMTTHSYHGMCSA
eukprot:14991-Heterococcus_DN1.PRE.3